MKSKGRERFKGIVERLGRIKGAFGKGCLGFNSFVVSQQGQSGFVAMSLQRESASGREQSV